MALLSSHTDEELLLLLKNGDEGAFTEIYTRYWKLLFSVAANKLDDPEDAKELVQDIFINIWKRHTELVIDYSLKSFLAAAVKYRVYTRLAHKYRLRVQQAELAAASSGLSVSYIEDNFSLNDLIAKIDLATAQLPDRCQLVYRLSREDGLTNKEIAEQLDISPKTVENQVTKALHHLRVAVRSFLFSFFL